MPRSITVKEWLKLLNKVQSHCCRSSSNSLYTEDIFESKDHLFRVYKEWCKDNHKPSIGRKMFNEILVEEIISIFKPTAKKEGNNFKREIHIQKKIKAYKAHIDATMSSSEVLTVDVQSVFLCP